MNSEPKSPASSHNMANPVALKSG